MKLYELLDTIGHNTIVESATKEPILEFDPRAGTQYIEGAKDASGKYPKSRITKNILDGGEYPNGAILPLGLKSYPNIVKHLVDFITLGGIPIPHSQINLKRLYADAATGKLQNFRMGTLSSIITKALAGKVPINTLTGISAAPYKSIIGGMLAESVEGAYNEYILNGDGIKAFNGDFDWKSVEIAIQTELQNSDNLGKIVNESEVETTQFPINVKVSIADKSFNLSEYYAHSVTLALQEEYGKVPMKDREAYVQDVKNRHDKLLGGRGETTTTATGHATDSDRDFETVDDYSQHYDPEAAPTAINQQFNKSTTSRL